MTPVSSFKYLAEWPYDMFACHFLTLLPVYHKVSLLASAHRRNNACLEDGQMSQPICLKNLA